ncbi:efflux RND transporter periplasmic adaptor subunit [Breoghania corrubedonensis]|nr:efflux RND transporter periplasmic adaptor subunit [Breoghania corrubedonensis]
MSACALALLLAGVCAQTTARAEPTGPKRVDTVTVAIRPYVKQVTLTGEIAARNQAALSFKVGGRVSDVHVDVGDHLKKGDELARIDPTEQEADVAAAKAAVTSAEARLKNARSTFDRQSALLASGFTTRSDYDSAEKALKTAQNTLESAQAQLGSANSNLADTVLKADAAGIVTERNVDPGQVVGAAQSVFNFAYDGDRDAIFDIQEQLLTGSAPARIDIALLSDPTVATAGHIREVSPLINPKTGTVEVKVALDRVPPQMQLGAPVAGSVRQSILEKVIELPWQALAADDGRPAVWVVDPRDNTVTLRPIRIERYNSSQIIVADGLAAGEQVVTSGSQMLRAGEPVQVVKTTEAGQ